MVKKQSNDKRMHARAPMSTKATIKIVDEKAAQEGIHRSALILPKNFKVENEKDQIAFLTSIVAQMTQAMINLDKKLDNILSIIEKKEISDYNLEVVETLDISGTGARFLIDGHTEIGQMMQITLYIDGFPLGTFNTFGKVARVESVIHENKKLNEVGLRFVNISDEEKEYLIAYTFQQQRHQIRKAKNREY